MYLKKINRIFILILVVLMFVSFGVNSFAEDSGYKVDKVEGESRTYGFWIFKTTYTDYAIYSTKIDDTQVWINGMSGYIKQNNFFAGLLALLRDFLTGLFTGDWSELRDNWGAWWDEFDQQYNVEYEYRIYVDNILEKSGKKWTSRDLSDDSYTINALNYPYGTHEIRIEIDMPGFDTYSYSKITGPWGVDIEEPSGRLVNMDYYVNQSSYIITAVNVQDNVGVQNVSFQTYALNNGSNVVTTNGNNLGSGTYEATISISDHNNVQGEYITDVYVVDTSGNNKKIGTNKVFIDTINPTCSSITSSESPTLDTSFTIYVNGIVEEGSGIDTIKADVWYEDEGKSESKTYDLTMNGSNASVNINISDFQNKRGRYIVEVFATDKAGNFSDFGTIAVEIGISISSLEINKELRTIQSNNRNYYKLTPVITPQNATIDSYNWEIVSGGDKIIAKDGMSNTENYFEVIDNDGGGTATIKLTVISNGEEYIAYEDVTLEAHITIDLNHNNVIMKINDTYNLTATVMPEYIINKAVTWESSNTSVAIVNDDGLIMAVGRGTAIVKAKSVVDPDAEATCTVSVPYVDIDDSDLSINQGESKEINVDIEDVGLNINVYSSNPNILTVEGDPRINGKVTITGINSGNAEIIIECKDLNNTVIVSDAVEFTVIDTMPPMASVTLESNNKMDNNLATIGDTITIFIETNEPIQMPSIKINGKEAVVIQNGDAQHWKAEYIIQSNDKDGKINLTIDMQDLNGNSIQVTNEEAITIIIPNLI